MAKKPAEPITLSNAPLQAQVVNQVGPLGGCLRRLRNYAIAIGLFLMFLYFVTAGRSPSPSKLLPTSAQMPTDVPTVVAVAATSAEPAPTNSPAPPTATITDTPLPEPTATITDTPPPTPTTPNTATPVFDEAYYVVKLSDGLFIVAGGRNIKTIRVADGRANGGERVAIIPYVTTENSADGYVEELMDILSGTAAAIEVNKLDLDSVSLIVGENENTTSLIVVVQVVDLMAFHRGEITRGTLLERVVITDMSAQSSALPSTPEKTWACGGDNYNCGDFSNRSEVMSYFNYCPGDPSKLDQDNDGSPCENM